MAEQESVFYSRGSPSLAFSNVKLGKFTQFADMKRLCLIIRILRGLWGPSMEEPGARVYL